LCVTDMLEEIGNRLMNKELRYDSEMQKNEHQRIYNDLNDNQKIAFDAIIKSADNNEGRQIFVEGHRGTGKTYLWKAITTKIRSEGKIVLAVASCGIVALLLEGGKLLIRDFTFHSPTQMNLLVRLNKVRI
jgi:chromosomal replication initiation ATPase DnaA